METTLSFLKMLQDAGMFNPATFAMTLDILTEGDSRKLAQEYLEDLGVPLLLAELSKTPLGIPSDETAGDIRLAITDNTKPCGFDPGNELHVLIVGEPGTGKTTLTNYLIAPQAMSKGIKCWFFVKARDTEKLLRFNKNIVTVDFADGQIKMNPLQAPKNVSRQEWFSLVWDMFVQAEAVYDGTKNFLIEQSYDLAQEYEKLGVEQSLFELHDFIKERKFPRGSRSFNYQESALNRISGILKGPLGNTIDCSSGCLEELVNENVIFNIGGLPASQQVFIVNFLTGWLFSYKRSNDCNERHLLIIDDAMLLFDANFEKRPDRGIPVINHYLAEVRKSKINMIVMGQFPSLMGQGIFGTSSIKIMFTLSDSRDADRMLDSMGMKDQEQRAFARGISKEKLEVIVKFSSRYNKPFFARVPALPGLERLDGIRISKEEKRECNSRKAYLFESVKPRRPYYEVQNEKEQAKEESRDEEKNFAKDILNDIYYRPFVSSTERAGYFKLNNDRSNEIYDYIETRNFVEAIFLNLKGRGGQSKFFWITDKGCELIGKPKKPEYSGGKGALHIFIQTYLHDCLKKKGIEAEIEKDIDGKKIDLFYVKEGERLGIEVCVSTFKTEYLNVLKNTGKCDRIFIICTDKNSKKKLTEELGALSKQVEIFVLYEFLKNL